MKDFLIDIIKHTASLGSFKNIRVDGTDITTNLSSTGDEKQVVLRAQLHAPIKEFEGLFGIPSLNWLNTLLNIPEYQDASAKCWVERQMVGTTEQPVSIKFENATSDYKNEFRLMAANLINSIEPLLKFNINSWPVEFEPSVASQQRLKYQSSSNPEEKVVTFRIENGDMKAIIGDVNGHCGSFIFHNGINPKVKETIMVPISLVINILNLHGDKKIKIGGPGMMISIDSGLANYDYIIPMLTK